MAPRAKNGGGGNRTRRFQSRNSKAAQRLWSMRQDVGVSWELNDDANRQPLEIGHHELAEVIIAWPTLSADLRVAILAIVQSGRVAEDASPQRSQQFGKRRVRAVDEVQWTS